MSTALRRWLPRTRLHDHREPASGVSCAGIGITTILCTPAEVGLLIYHITLAAGVVPVYFISLWYNSCIIFSKGPCGRVLIGAAVIGHHFLTSKRALSFQLNPTKPMSGNHFFFSVQFSSSKNNTRCRGEVSAVGRCLRFASLTLFLRNDRA